MCYRLLCVYNLKVYSQENQIYYWGRWFYCMFFVSNCILLIIRRVVSTKEKNMNKCWRFLVWFLILNNNFPCGKNRRIKTFALLLHTLKKEKDFTFLLIFSFFYYILSFFINKEKASKITILKCINNEKTM